MAKSGKGKVHPLGNSKTPKHLYVSGNVASDSTFPFKSDRSERTQIEIIPDRAVLVLRPELEYNRDELEAAIREVLE